MSSVCRPLCSRLCIDDLCRTGETICGAVFCEQCHKPCVFDQFVCDDCSRECEKFFSDDKNSTVKEGYA